MFFFPVNWSADDRIAFLELLNEHLDTFTFINVYELDRESFYGWGCGSFKISIVDAKFYDEHGNKIYFLDVRTKVQFIIEEVEKVSKILI